MNKQKRLIIGISGATGAIYGVRMLEILAKIGDIETHLVLSKAGKMTIQVETPYSVKDVEAMASLTRMGAIIFPPVPAFYHRPKTLDDVINQTVTRILDQFDIDAELFHRWDDKGMSRHPDAGKTTNLASAKERQAAKKSR